MVMNSPDSWRSRQALLGRNGSTSEVWTANTGSKRCASEAPVAALLGHHEPWFVVPLKQLVGDSPGGVLESKH